MKLVVLTVAASAVALVATRARLVQMMRRVVMSPDLPSRGGRPARSRITNLLANRRPGGGILGKSLGKLFARFGSQGAYGSKEAKGSQGHRRGFVIVTTRPGTNRCGL